MSEILENVEKSFDQTAKQLDKLSEDLNRLADLEADLGTLSSNLNLAATNLRQLSRDHAKFLAGASDANDHLKRLAVEMDKFEPEQTEIKLEEIRGQLADILDEAKSNETAIKEGFLGTKSSSSLIVKLLLFMFVCQAIGFVLLAYRLY